jgi:hypothetical protein
MKKEIVAIFSAIEKKKISLLKLLLVIFLTIALKVNTYFENFNKFNFLLNSNCIKST